VPPIAAARTPRDCKRADRGRRGLWVVHLTFASGEGEYGRTTAC